MELISTPSQFHPYLNSTFCAACVTVLICQTSSSLLERTSHDLDPNKLMVIIYWSRGPRCNLAKVTFITPNGWQQQIKAAPSFPSSAAWPGSSLHFGQMADRSVPLRVEARSPTDPGPGPPSTGRLSASEKTNFLFGGAAKMAELKIRRQKIYDDFKKKSLKKQT